MRRKSLSLKSLPVLGPRLSRGHPVGEPASECAASGHG